MIDLLRALVRQAVICLAAITPLHAQQYGLEVEVVAADIGLLSGPDGIVDLTGYTTYRAYFTTVNANDDVIAIFGDESMPLYINTTTSFYQSQVGGLTGSSLNPAFFPFFPEAAHDSWITIGCENNGCSVESTGTSIDFDPGGGNLVWDDPIGGAVFWGEGIAGSDLRVLIGQFTTDGLLSLQVNAQIWPASNGQNSFGETVFFSGKFRGLFRYTGM